MRNINNDLPPVKRPPQADTSLVVNIEFRLRGVEPANGAASLERFVNWLADQPGYGGTEFTVKSAEVQRDRV